MNALRMNAVFSAATFVLLLLFWWLKPGSYVQYGILAISLLVTGIPHGAIDHLIFCNRRGIRLSWKPLFQVFFLPYVLLIGATVLCWAIFPTLAFCGFVLMAGYHFGQSQLFYWPVAHSIPLKSITFISWGLLVVGGLWYFHWELVSPSLETMFSWSLQNYGVVHTALGWVCWASALYLLVLFAYLAIARKIPLGWLLSELVATGMVMLFIHQTGPVLGFAVYFGLWHSARVMITEYGYLSRHSKRAISPLAFIRSFIPFSLLSFLGLALLLLVAYLFERSVSPYLILIVFISALTTPHAWVMESMYHQISGFAGRHKAPLIH